LILFAAESTEKREQRLVLLTLFIQFFEKLKFGVVFVWIVAGGSRFILEPSDQKA
jgi:hypothetical protein